MRAQPRHPLQQLASAILALTAIAISAAPSNAAGPAQLHATLEGPWRVMFDPQLHRCDGHDVPDTPARAFRNAHGQIVMFALHYIARPLRGASLDTLKIDCRSSYGSSLNPDPAAYDSQSWIAATWTRDGHNVEAIVHHEYRAALHKRCSVPASNALACWYNTILAARSHDGGSSFAKHAYPVIAAAPFRQEFEQQRHRGFLNPSNMFAHGKHVYFFAAETGWSGQPHGVCLFRSADPSKPRSWRAWDGSDFTIQYDDPYRPNMRKPRACKPVAPFPAQVGAVVRHRASGLYLAVVQTWKDERYFPVPGFYYATSRDLLNWSAPALLMATKTQYDNPCGSRALNSYPSILDANAEGRNFDDTGSSAWLYWVSMRIEGCNHTSDRKLIRQRLWIAPR